MMTSKQRPICALRGRQTDRLPVTTHDLMDSFLERQLGGALARRFFDRFGLDSIQWVVMHLLDEAAGELATVGREEADHAGTPLFFRTPEQKPMAMRSAEQNGAPAEAPVLQSQHILVAGMLRPAHLLDLMRNFSVFQQVDGKTRKGVARYQQFRAVHKAVLRLQEGRTREWSSPR